MAKALQRTAHVLDPVTTEEIELTKISAADITTFLRGLVPFFTKAKELEDKALATLAAARVRKPPTSPEDDETLQLEIKRANKGKRLIEEHWKITAALSALHKRTVARRQRGVIALEQAAKLGNDLHNAFVEAARRTAEAEQYRLRREAEDKARADREAELDRLEAEALEREANENLSAREIVFVLRMVESDDVTAAAKAADYRYPFQAGARLMGLAKIQAAIKDKREAFALRRQIDARKDEPFAVNVPKVASGVIMAAGASSRENWSGVVNDEPAFVDAVCDGKLGIPRDALQINRVKLNEYARSLKHEINRWPGVHAERKNQIV